MAAQDATTGAVLLEESSSADSPSTPDDNGLAQLAKDLALLDPKNNAANSKPQATVSSVLKPRAVSLSWLEGASDNQISSKTTSDELKSGLSTEASAASGENSDMFGELKQLLGPARAMKGSVGKQVEKEFDDLGKQQEMRLNLATGQGPSETSLIQGQ